jgi:fructosamine-3-kinase
VSAVPAALTAAAGEALGAAVTGGRSVSGGDLNDAWRLELADGRTVFVKTAADAPAGGYATEAAGLRWLGAAGALAVPEVLAVVDAPADSASGRPRVEAQAPNEEPASGLRLLALEWIDEGTLGLTGEEELGRGLAALHAAGAPGFGSFGTGVKPSSPSGVADPDSSADAPAPRGGASPLRIGPLQLPNGPTDSWAELYGEYRLRPLARRAVVRGALPDGTEALIDRVCERLPELAGSAEAPARLHGDLWSGNVMADTRGTLYLIDPAAYGGHREVDLAMLRLFGGPSERCFAAYAEVAPLADGHADRIELWQLFPLLVHAVLFGGHYGGSVARIARRYAG